MVINQNVDIHKLIYEAMEKKDRYVSLYISDYGMTVNIYPIEENKAHWIDIATDDSNTYDDDTYVCSNCREVADEATHYCPYCGEQMHGTRKVGDEQ